MTARLAHLMATALLVVTLDQIVRLVHSTAIHVRLVTTVAHVVTSVHAMTVRLVRSVTAILVRHVVTLVQTAQRVRLVPTVMVVVRIA